MFITLLACALIIAWFGHDIFRTDYHRELGQASWDTGSWRSQVDDSSELTNLTVLPTSLFRWVAPRVVIEPFTSPVEDKPWPLLPIPFCLNIPRPPPVCLLS